MNFSRTLSNDIYKRRYFSSDQGGINSELCLSIMHYVPTFIVGEDFSNDEQEEKNKFM